MAFEVEGTIKLIMDTQTFGSGFTKREFVVTIGDDRYPQDIKMEVVKDKTSLLDRYKTGQRVKIGFDLRGGEHNGRYYVNVQAWRIHPADGSEPPTPSGGESPSAPRSSAPPRQDRAPRSDGGGGGGGGGDRGRGDRGRKDWDEERRGGGGRREEYRGGGGRRGNQEDDIDF